MVSLSSDLSNLLKAKVEEGRYGDEEAVIYAALNALSRHEEEDLASIKRGLADLEAGRCRPFEEADAEFRKQHGLGESR